MKIHVPKTLKAALAGLLSVTLTSSLALASLILPTPQEQATFNPPITETVGPNPEASFLRSTLANVPPGYSITNTTYLDWCIDADTAIDANRPYLPVIYSSLDTAALAAAGIPTANLDKVNWILNHKPVGANALTIQHAIYVVLGQTGAGRQLIEAGGFFDQFGFAPYDPAASAALVAAANANGVGFVPGPGEITGVILDLPASLNGGIEGQRNIIEVLAPSGRIGDFVWRDLNSNGIQDIGEPGIAGVNLSLKVGNVVIDTAVTDATGFYLFDGLLADTYVVTVEPSAALAGLFPTIVNAAGSTTLNDSNATPATVTLPTDDAEDLSIDFGYVAPVPPTGRIGDFVWRDLNGNGRQDAGEPGINGVTVVLTDAADNFLASVATAGNGGYLFTGLTAGTYKVSIVNVQPALAGLTPTITGVGNTVGDSNVNPSTVILATDSSQDLTIDFGYVNIPPTGRIGDFVWKDLNANGRQDAGEPGINGVIVVLRDALDNVLATTATAGNGGYLFTGLAAGTYAVSIDNTQAALFGHTPTTINVGDTIGDSNANPSTVILPTDSSEDLTIDFGYKAVPPPTGGFVTFTMGGWGAKPAGNNPGKFLATNFSTVFPAGITIGGLKTAKFTSAKAVENFLPSGGAPAALKASVVNPASKLGVLAGQVLALQISVGFSDAGITPVGLSGAVFKSGKFAGQTVGQVLALANAALGGAPLPPGISLSDLSDACTVVNENYVEGSNGGKLIP